jgi:large subunit ribosomal protein L28
MPRVCEICGKGRQKGHLISHSHKVSNRHLKPNLQSVKVRKGGKITRILVCTKCIKAGKVERAT